MLIANLERGAQSVAQPREQAVGQSIEVLELCLGPRRRPARTTRIIARLEVLLHLSQVAAKLITDWELRQVDRISKALPRRFVRRPQAVPAPIRRRIALHASGSCGITIIIWTREPGNTAARAA